MAYSLIFDDTSLFLTLTIIVLLSLTIYVGKSYQPLVHPLILSRQSDVSPIRHRGQSAIYRNANSPSGLSLASKPRRAISRVGDIIQHGSDAPRWSYTAKRSFYGQEMSNEDIHREAREFGRGLAGLCKLSSPSQLSLAVCVEKDSLHSTEAILSGSVQHNESFTPGVIPLDLLADGQIPADLPSIWPTRRFHAVFTTLKALKHVLPLPSVDETTVLVFAEQEEALSARSATSNRTISFGEVLHSADASAGTEPSSSSSEDTDATPHSVYWAGDAGLWIPVTHASLIASLTANLGLYSTDAQPDTQDHILVAATLKGQEEGSVLSSPHLLASQHPAGVVPTLLALYSGAAISAATSSSPLSGKEQPTLLYASPLAASSVANDLFEQSRRHVLARAALRNRMAFLRHGTFSYTGLWDRLVFDGPRRKLACHKIRSVLIVNGKGSVPQSLLDLLRAHLACAIRQAYLPAQPCSLQGSDLTSGVGSESPTTASKAFILAPVTAAHSLDLQAFIDAQGKLSATHVGPPNVTVEVKVVETVLAKRSGCHVEGAKTADPSGEVFVRGFSITGVDSDKQWVSTGQMGSFRPNGTLLIIDNEEVSSSIAVPTFSSSPKRRTKSSNSALQASKSSLGLLTLLLSFVACLGVDASMMPMRDFTSRSASHFRMQKRADAVNNTLVETAIMGFLAAPRASWEQGVAQSCILEIYGGAWSVFTAANGQGPPYVPQALRPDAGGFPSKVLSMAYSSVQTQDSLGKLCSFVTGDEEAGSGSALDGASCGEAVLLAAFLNGDIANGAVANRNGMWATAARRQLNYMLNTAPKGDSGIISMRSANLAYWSDAMYMMPPYLAFYGLLTNNQTLLQAGYMQMYYYYSTLRVPSGPAQGLVRHIVNGTNPSGSGNDNGAWLTGNAWAVGGMVKVIATIAQSPYASQMQAQIGDLVTWTSAILDGCYRFADPLIHNYVNDSTTFRDAAGSAMIAYATYRLASLVPTNKTYIAAADAIYDAVQNKLTPMGIFDDSVDVPDALTFTEPSQMSPESLSFLVLMSAARRDYLQSNVTGIGGVGTGSQNQASSSLTAAPLGHSTWVVALLLCSLSLALTAFNVV